MTNFAEMHAALSQADTGVREFLVLWAEQLSEDRQAKLHDLMTSGVRLGCLFVVGGTAPTVEVRAIDASGGQVVLERLDFDKAGR